MSTVSPITLTTAVTSY